MIQYGLNQHNCLINYDQIDALSKKYKPKLIIAGGSAYSRFIDFKIFKEISIKYGSLLLVDMAHFSGLVAGGVHPSPFPYADIVIVQHIKHWD